MSGDAKLFRFAQFEFPWLLGPEPGRYVLRPVRGEPPEQILVIATLGAPQRRLLGGRRPKDAAPAPEPTPVATSRVTVIDADPLADEPAARAWMKVVSGGDAAARLDEALRTLNGLLRVHRAASADPLVREAGREQALVARLGYGEGEQVADGRWTAALDVPHRAERQRREAALRPQERLAAVLGGRDTVLACEELTVRARQDLDAGRGREAALQLRVAFEAALAELDGRQDLAERLDGLREQRGAVGEAANAALAGELGAEELVSVEGVLERLEAALRARSAAGIG